MGLPELRERLNLRRNRSLYSRLHRRLRVDALTPSDTGEYIAMRLSRAGAKSPLVSDEACALVHEATGGAMREIDRVLEESLRLAAAQGRKLVEGRLVSMALELTGR